MLEEERQNREYYELKEVSEEEVTPEPIPERRRPSSRTLERVVPVAQRVTAGVITVAIASLELQGEGLWVLRWWISFGERALRRDPDLGFGMPEPEFEIRDATGRILPWSPLGAGYSDGEGDGDTEIRDLPGEGELEVGVPRLISDAYMDGEFMGGGPSYEGPWTFRFTL